MAEPRDVEVKMEDDYDEEADSDFDAASANSADQSSSSEDEDEADVEASARSRKRRKVQKPQPPPVPDLDSGDEATIQEHKKTRRKQRRKGKDGEVSGEESEGWRARTRAMREREKEEKKSSKLASVQGSTIDVSKLWEEMNSTDFMPKGHGDQPQIQIPENEVALQASTTATDDQRAANKENNSGFIEMITIKRTYKFAGEVHTEEKTVPKSSAEARLWLAQEASKPQAKDAEGRIIHRPLRKISRFDPNVSNLDSFKGNWTATAGGKKGPTGPKLNVVEKSKMDWAVHVDAEGLKEELDEHAKAKEGYLSRMDFLRDVEQRKETEARAARLQGQ